MRAAGLWRTQPPDRRLVGSRHDAKDGYVRFARVRPDEPGTNEESADRVHATTTGLLSDPQFAWLAIYAKAALLGPGWQDAGCCRPDPGMEPLPCIKGEDDKHSRPK